MENKMHFSGKILSPIFGLLFILCYSSVKTPAQKIKSPVVAGQFYPADPDELQGMIRTYLDTYPLKKLSGDIRGMVVPHAAYIYSGSVAAAAYRQLAGRAYDAVVIIAPSHREAYEGVSIYSGKGMRTPLGIAEIDRALARKIEKADKRIIFSTQGYQIEHSLEVQLPFLQTVLPDVPIVPMVMGYQTFDVSYGVGKALGSVLKDKNVLLVASTDLSHYHPYAEAVSLDKMVIEALENFDSFLLSQNLFQQNWEACGGGPMIAALVAAQIMGANTAEIMKYANSGDITGDKKSVVGYVSEVLTAAPEQAHVYTPEERDRLLTIAREAVEYSVTDRKLPGLKSLSKKLARKRGVFVTLKIDGQLRGCMGNIFAEESLAEAVQTHAVSSAYDDLRFKPVSEQELPFIEYEISVLSPLRQVDDVDEIEVGKHGILMVGAPQSAGTLLPQIPVENGWNRRQFLEQACIKANLPKDAWKDPDTYIFIFSAEVFGEHDN